MSGGGIAQYGKGTAAGWKTGGRRRSGALPDLGADGEHLGSMLILMTF
ncbi:MAG: hypothetical protein ACLVBJ_06670 [Pilosibacter sp.]